MKEYIFKLKNHTIRMFLLSLCFLAGGVLFVAMFIKSDDKIDTILSYGIVFLAGLLGLGGVIVFGFFSDYRALKKDIKSLGDYNTVIEELDSAPRTNHGSFETIITDEIFVYLSTECCRIFRKNDILSVGSAVAEQKRLICTVKKNGKDKDEYIEIPKTGDAILLHDIIIDIISGKTEQTEKETTL